MGVLACNRLGCDGIMCDRYSDEHGYICDDCFEEILVALPESIEIFMQTQTKIPKKEDWYARYNAVFPRTILQKRLIR